MKNMLRGTIVKQMKQRLTSVTWKKRWQKTPSENGKKKKKNLKNPG